MARINALNIEIIQGGGGHVCSRPVPILARTIPLVVILLIGILNLNARDPLIQLDKLIRGQSRLSLREDG